MSTVTFDSLATFMTDVIESFGWDAVSLLYNSHGLDEIVNTHRFCYLAMNPLHNELNRKDVDVQIHVFHPDDDEYEGGESEHVQTWDARMEMMLIERVGRDRAGKFKFFKKR